MATVHLNTDVRFSLSSNYVEEYVTAKEQNRQLVYMIATSDFRNLSTNPIFKEQDTMFQQKFHDIGEDKYIVAPASEGPLATSRVGECFAICLRCKNKKGELFLALCHSTNISSIDSVIKFLEDKLISSQCDKSTIECYIIGGKTECEDPDGTSASFEIDAFNERKSLNVVWDGAHINYSKKSIFSPLKSSEDAGDKLFY